MIAFDAKCYELAKDFLADEPLKDSEENRVTLAQAIQDEIESVIKWTLRENGAGGAKL